MISHKKKGAIIALFLISIAGSIPSSILLYMYTRSWSFNLTSNPEESQANCAISENGNLIVVGSGNNHLYLFEKTSPQPLWSYRGNRSISDVDISADGRYIVACELEGKLLLFEKSGPNPIWTYSTNGIIKAKISADGNYIIMCTTYMMLYLFQRDYATPLWTKTSAVSGSYFPVDISGDGNEIVSGYDGIIYFFEKSSSTPIWQYDTGETVISALAISFSGDLIALGGQDRKIYTFNKTNPIPIKIFDLTTSINSLSMSADGTYIAVGCPDGFYLYEKSKDTCLWRYLTGLYEGYAIGISSDGKFVIASTFDYVKTTSHLYLFNRASNNPLWSKQAIGYVDMVKTSSNGNIIAAVSGYRLYLLDREQPVIDELMVIFSAMILLFSIAIGFIIGITLLISWRIRIKNEKARIEEEQREKEITGIIAALDQKFKDWDDKEREEGKV
jgi:outer membrane protein assembly factor BamB